MERLLIEIRNNAIYYVGRIPLRLPPRGPVQHWMADVEELRSLAINRRRCRWQFLIVATDRPNTGLDKFDNRIFLILRVLAGGGGGAEKNGTTHDGGHR